MSFAGLKTFERNLQALMDSRTFKEADDGARFRMGGALIRSKYGAIGKCQSLQKEKEPDEKART